MPTYKNIRIPKRGGGTRLQRVQVLASGKYKFVKNPGTKRRSTSSRSSKRRRSSPRRKSSRRSVRKVGRRSRKTIPLAPVLGIAAGFVSSTTGPSPVQYFMDGNIEYALAALSQNYLGYDPICGDFNIKRMASGLLPAVIGLLVHKFVGGPPLNLNRTLAAAGVPLFRI